MAKKIVMTPGFVQDLGKLKQSGNEDAYIQALRNQGLKQNSYIPYWRKQLGCSYNKHDTLAMARLLTPIWPRLSLWQRKLIVSQCDWYNYRWFVDYVITPVNGMQGMQINKLLSYLDDGGQTMWTKHQDPKYREALSNWFDLSMQRAKHEPDGSNVLGEAHRAPILDVTDEERAKAQQEMVDETNEIARLLTMTIKENPRIWTSLVGILRIWIKNYRRKSYNAAWRETTKQMQDARQGIINRDWLQVEKAFRSFPGWWD